MKHVLAYMLCMVCYWASAQQHRHCGVDDLLEELKVLDVTAYEDFYQISDQPSAEWRSDKTIPVVVHIVYSEDRNNISEFQILSQIEALNRGFNEIPTQIDVILPAHRSLISVPNIRFALACTDPEGKFTNGITRTQTSISNIGFVTNSQGDFAVHHTEDGGHDPWPTESYINIWVTEMENEFLGRSSIPAQLVDPLEDGVVINVRNFGFAGIAVDRQPYHLGRTLVHEIGHYLGLMHPWGRSDGSCLLDDGVEDTPLQSEIYYDCPSEIDAASCGTPDMALNIMGYADDVCLLYFTQGQVNRMTSVLNEFRSSLCESSAADNCGLLPNDNDLISFWNHILNREWIARFPTQQQSISAEIYNLKGRLIQSFSFANTDLVHIQPNAFAAGMYLIKFTFDGKTEVRRVAIY